MQTPAPPLLGLGATVRSDFDGFSATLTCRVSSEALARELECFAPDLATACTPAPMPQAMRDQLTQAAQQLLDQALPALLTGLFVVSSDHQAALNEACIVAQGGVA